MISECFSYPSYGCELPRATGMRQLLWLSVQMLDDRSNFCLLKHHLVFGNAEMLSQKDQPSLTDGILRVLHGITYGFSVAKNDLFPEQRHLKRVLQHNVWVLSRMKSLKWLIIIFVFSPPITKPNWNTFSSVWHRITYDFPFPPRGTQAVKSCTGDLQLNVPFTEHHFWAGSAMRLSITPTGSLPSDSVVLCVIPGLSQLLNWLEITNMTGKMKVDIWDTSTGKDNSYMSDCFTLLWS